MADIRLSWDGDPSLTYQIQYRQSTSSTWLEPSGSPYIGLSYDISGLLEGETYMFRVKNTCSGDWMYQSFTTATPGCAAVTAFTTTTVSSNSISVSFTVSPSAVNGHIVEWKKAGALSWSSSPVITTGFFTIGGLTGGTLYEIKVTSLCAGDDVTSTNIISEETTSTLSACSEVIVDSLVVESNTSNYTATWLNSGGYPTSFIIDYTTNDVIYNPISIISLGTNTLTYTLPLPFPSAHVLRVVPKCLDNSTGTGDTGEYTPPMEPVAFVTIENGTNGAMTFLSFNGSPDVTGSGEISISSSLNYYHPDIFSFPQSVMADFDSENDVFVVELERASTVIWSGLIAYTGSQIPILVSQTLVDQDIIRVYRD